MKVSAIPTSLLGFLVAPIVYDTVLRYVYATDIFTVLLQGPLGWQKYIIADVITWIVVLLFVSMTAAGARRAVHGFGGR
jgi:hypothetical protein